jgi:hypothetical protein
MPYMGQLAITSDSKSIDGRQSADWTPPSSLFWRIMSIDRFFALCIVLKWVSFKILLPVFANLTLDVVGTVSIFLIACHDAERCVLCYNSQLNSSTRLSTVSLAIDRSAGTGTVSSCHSQLHSSSFL